MKPQANRILTIITSPVPALLCVLGSILPQWLPWIFFAVLMIGGIVVWWKYHKKKAGIIAVVAALLMGVMIILGSQKESNTATISSVGEDPLRSFFELNQEAQQAWDTMDIRLSEQMATIALKNAIELGADNYSFAYYDNIWNKLEAAKREGSANAYHNMAVMCANGLGRPRSSDDAIELCYKAISINPSDIDSYLMLEALCVDSTKYPEIYSNVRNWRRNIDKEDSIISEKFGEMTGFYDVLNEGDDWFNKVLMRRKSYEAVLYADKTSPFWKVIDENVGVLRASALSGNVSFHTLYLAAYYYGKDMRDSAVFFYDRYLNCPLYWRAVTGPEAGIYGVVPDTIISVYSRNVMPLLIGLSCQDLDYLATCVGGDKNRPIGGIDTLNHYFMYTSGLAMNLKNNRCNIKSFDYVSEIESVVKQYKQVISGLLQTKKAAIGKEKSKKYNYNFLVDIHNDPVVGDSIPGQKLAAVGVFSPADYDTTLIWTNVSGNKIPEEINDAAKRASKTTYYKDLLH